jgi:hypothetical protein
MFPPLPLPLPTRELITITHLAPRPQSHPSLFLTLATGLLDEQDRRAEEMQMQDETFGFRFLLLPGRGAVQLTFLKLKCFIPLKRLLHFPMEARARVINGA